MMSPSDLWTIHALDGGVQIPFFPLIFSLSQLTIGPSSPSWEEVSINVFQLII